MKEDDNVCCRYFAVVECGDTDEHKHLGCVAGEDIFLVGNEHVRVCCLGGGFKGCESYPCAKPLK